MLFAKNIKEIGLLLFISSSISCTTEMRYPNWKKVNFTDSVIGKPCVYIKEEEGYIDPADIADDMASIAYEALDAGGNTVLKRGVHSDAIGIVSYFKCGKGLPIYRNEAWLVKPLYGTNIDKSEYEKVAAKCQYEVHKAMVDTSHVPQTRAIRSDIVYPTGDPLVGISNNLTAINNIRRQEEADEQDKINLENRERRLKQDRVELYDECLRANGFVSYRSRTNTDYAILNRTCPKIDNEKNPCYVP